MTTLLLTLAISFAAFCVWLIVRIVNRGWRPGRRFWIAAPLTLVLAYPLSFGPAAWIVSWMDDPNAQIKTRKEIEGTDVASVIYRPIVMAWMQGPKPIQTALSSYANLFSLGHVSVYEAGGEQRLIVYPNR